MKSLFVTIRSRAALGALAILVGSSPVALAQHEDPEAGMALHVAGETLSLTIPDPIEESLGIQWAKDGVALADGGRISGAETRTLEITDLTVDDAGVYSAEYQGHAKHGLTYSVEVHVALAALPFAEGDSLSLTIPPPVHEEGIHWYKNGVELAPGQGIGGTTGRTLTIASLDHGHEGIYKAVYPTHAKHNHTFGPYYVKVVGHRATFLLGETISLEIPPPFVEPVEWLKDGVTLADGGRVSGATSGSLSISGAMAGDGGIYTASYASHAKHHHTYDTRVYVVAEEVVKQAGQTFTLTIPEPVEESLPITWYRDGVLLSDSGRVSGATTAELTISALVAGDSGVYWAEYEEHAKHHAMLEPVMLVVSGSSGPGPGMPVAGGAGLAMLCGALALAAAATQRRK